MKLKKLSIYLRLRSKNERFSLTSAQPHSQLIAVSFPLATICSGASYSLITHSSSMANKVLLRHIYYKLCYITTVVSILAGILELQYPG